MRLDAFSPTCECVRKRKSAVRARQMSPSDSLRLPLVGASYSEYADRAHDIEVIALVDLGDDHLDV